MGRRREWNFALESYWSGRFSAANLLATARRSVPLAKLAGGSSTIAAYRRHLRGRRRCGFWS
ncbi:hypothetical protein NKH74_33855 [Mesorhizobium sp. M0933]